MSLVSLRGKVPKGSSRDSVLTPMHSCWSGLSLGQVKRLSSSIPHRLEFSE